jgi:hypothetical protein
MSWSSSMRSESAGSPSDRWLCPVSEQTKTSNPFVLPSVTRGEQQPDALFHSVSPTQYISNTAHIDCVQGERALNMYAVFLLSRRHQTRVNRIWIDLYTQSCFPAFR